MDYLTKALKGNHGFSNNEEIGIYLTDGLGYTVGVNRAYELLTAIEENEVFGRHMKSLEEESLIDRSVTLLVLKQKTPVTIEQKILRTGKKIIVTGNPILDKDGEVIFVATTAFPSSYVQDNRIELQKNTMIFPCIDGIIANSKSMQQVIMRAVRSASVDSNVLIRGESGVGKEVVAKIIHQLSPRKNKPFIKVNVAAIPEELFESELFGYRGGAFTGALKSGKKGLVQAASGGTLFLDEISEVPLKIQVKLLRLLQNKEAIPVGSVEAEQVDVRFVAATNRDIQSLIEAGEFREDLFYRLNVIPIYIPPLRERVDDIFALVNSFLKEICDRYKIEKLLTPGAIQALVDYSWPGNVRELQNIVERLVVLYQDSRILKEHVLEELMLKKTCVPDRMVYGSNFSLQNAVQEFEKNLIEQVFKENNCNLEQTARILGTHRTTIMRKLRRFHV